MKPGRVRIAAAKLLTDFFGVLVKPENVVPATGHWRTNTFADVYRFEVWVYGLMEGHADHSRCYGCWEKMTDFVRDAKRYGIELTYKGREIQAKSNDESS